MGGRLGSALIPKSLLNDLGPVGGGGGGARVYVLRSRNCPLTIPVMVSLGEGHFSRDRFRHPPKWVGCPPIGLG